MSKINYSAAAIQDLEQIGDYIADTLKNPMAALNTVSNIQDTIDKLSEFPLIGPQLSLAIDIDMGTDYRFLVCGNYIAFYHEEKDIVFIDRILYGRRDYIKILFGEVSKGE